MFLALRHRVIPTSAKRITPHYSPTSKRYPLYASMFLDGINHILATRRIESTKSVWPQGFQIPMIRAYCPLVNLDCPDYKFFKHSSTPRAISLNSCPCEPLGMKIKSIPDNPCIQFLNAALYLRRIKFLSTAPGTFFLLITTERKFLVRSRET